MTVLLTHWGRATHIYVGKLTIIGSDNGLSPGRRQAIIWTNVGILLIGPLRTNFSEILIENQTFSLKKMHLKMASAKWRSFCLGLNVLTGLQYIHSIFVWKNTSNALMTGPLYKRHYLNSSINIVMLVGHVGALRKHPSKIDTSVLDWVKILY